MRGKGGNMSPPTKGLHVDENKGPRPMQKKILLQRRRIRNFNIDTQVHPIISGYLVIVFQETVQLSTYLKKIRK
ncbi:unnamed protein product [Callosobruchus maculatus]|uniref:Uncharacterized protein n=1 Tax=Callosobruchus maculatus TaxID=64391 RepID=A0A653C9H5_CALMS|nr:unnamed protein product [Callosobruchus maculatus]